MYLQPEDISNNFFIMQEDNIFLPLAKNFQMKFKTYFVNQEKESKVCKSIVNKLDFESYQYKHRWKKGR